VPKKGHIPERTCVICRKKAPKYTLHRFCIKAGYIIWDRDFRTGGRGAYLCSSCIEELKKRKAFSRLLKALRAEGVKNREAFLEEIERGVKSGFFRGDS